MSAFQIFLQQILNGLTIGAVYALIALGYTMVYGIIQLINFAHGEIFMVGGYIGLTILLASGSLPIAQTPFFLVIVLALTAAVSGLLGFCIDRKSTRLNSSH